MFLPASWVRAPSLAALLACALAFVLVGPGCLPWAARALPYRLVGRGAPGGAAPPYDQTLPPLMAQPGGYVLTSESDWARLRDALNLGTNAQLYGALDFSRHILLVYFHGPGAGQGDHVTLESLRVSGQRVTAGFGIQRGLLTAVGYPYMILAVHRADLAGPGKEPHEWTFDIRSGRRQIVLLRAAVAPPAEGKPLVEWPAPRMLGPGAPQDWSPDGTAILVAAEHPVPSGPRPAPQGLFIVDAAGATDVRLAVFAPDHGSAGSARFSPDGTLVALMHAVDGRLRLLVAPVDGRSVPRDVTPAGFDIAAPASWSPDGRAIAVIGRETGGSRHHVLLAVPVSPPGAPQRLFSQAGWLTSPVWAGDGAVYFLRQTSQGSVLAARPAAGGTVGDLVPAARYALSPGAEWLAYIVETGQEQASLRVMPTSALLGAGGTGDAGTEVARGQIGSPAWSPDGRMLAYTARSAGRHAVVSVSDLWMLHVDRGVTQQLTAGANVTGALFSTDGTRIAFTLHPSGATPGTPHSMTALLDLRR